MTRKSDETARVYERMRMAAYDYVDVAACIRELNISGLIILFCIADMGDSYDQVTFFLIFQISGKIVGRRDNLLEIHIYAMFGYKALRIDVKPYEPYFFASDFLDHIGLEHALKFCAVKIIIGREPVGLHGLVFLCEVCHAVVKLMVAEDAHVIPHHVHERIFHVTAKIFKIQRALNHVAGIYRNYIFLRFPH